MPGIAVKAADSAGGAQLAGGQDFVRVDGLEIVLLGDPVTPHGLAIHGGPIMAEGSAFVRINGIPICIAGNAANCGHKTSGRDWISASG